MADPAAPRPGTAPQNGRWWGGRAADWAEIQEPQTQTAYAAVFDQIGLAAGQGYCDVGCGAGLAAQMAAARGARVSGLDASAPLLAIARSRVPAGDFRQGEMEELPFADGAFDVVVGFNSFQYAAEPAKALGEGRRVARPGGKVAALVWGPPEGMPAAALVAALRPLPPPPPPGAPGPFALSGEAALRSLAAAAGLKSVTVHDVASPWFFPDRATALRGLGSSGVAMRARDLAGSEAVDRAHGAALDPFVQPDGSYRVGAVFRWVTGEA